MDGINRRIRHKLSDSDELKYWNKNVVPYYTEGTSKFGQEMQISPIFLKTHLETFEGLFITIIKTLVNGTFGDSDRE